jgi:uncharacterized membrane protein YbhN (UPF0104 family)
MSKKIIIPLVKTVLPLFLGAYLIWHSFTSMSSKDEIQFYKAIKEANYFWIILALLIGTVAFFSRAYRWKYALEPLGYKTKFWNRYHAIMIGYLINLTIPRAGEASRAAMLYRSDGVPFSTSFGTIIAERAVDFVILASLGAFTAFIGYDDFFAIIEQMKSYNFTSKPSDGQGFPWKIVIGSCFAIGAVVMIYLFIKKEALRLKILSFTKDVVAGLFSIFKLKSPIAYIGHTIAIWVSYLLMFTLPFFALEQTHDFPVSGIFIGFIAGSIGIVLTNGGIGTYPILVGLVVAFYIGKDYPEQALGIGTALGWIIWLSQTVLMIILGLISLVLIPKNFTEENGKNSVSSIETSDNN